MAALARLDEAARREAVALGLEGDAIAQHVETCRDRAFRIAEARPAAETRNGHGVEAEVFEYGPGSMPDEEAADDEKYNLDAEVERLATMTPLAYDRERSKVAEALGVRVATLDAEVARRRKPPLESTADDPLGLGWHVDVASYEVDGARLLDDLVELIRRYVALPHHGDVAIALWIAFAWVHETARHSPILTIASPTKRCGKSTLLELVGRLVPRALPSANVTSAALFRAVEAWRPTLLIDEADSFALVDEGLRGILNSGHSRAAARVLRVEEVNGAREVKAFSTWCPKAIAVIGSLPNTLMDRSIVISLKRRLPSEKVARLPRDAGDFADLRSRLAKWAEDHVEALASADPSGLDALDDRAADNWRPLVVVADIVGQGWPEKARAAALELSGGRDAEDDSPAVTLLKDVAAIFAEHNSDRIESAALAGKLATMEARPWPEWKSGKSITPRQIARLLAPFGIAPALVRFPTGVARGYTQSQFDEALTRYLPPLDPLHRYNPQKSAKNEVFRSVTTESGVTDRNCPKSAATAICNGVTDRKGVTGLNESGKPTDFWSDPAATAESDAIYEREEREAIQWEDRLAATGPHHNHNS